MSFLHGMKDLPFLTLGWLTLSGFVERNALWLAAILLVVALAAAYRARRVRA